MSNNTLVVGDVHGRGQVVEKALEHNGPVVFLGDLVDSFNISIFDQLKCVESVLDAIDNRNAQLIAGNHEFSYLLKDQRCSGFNYNLDTELRQSGLLDRIRFNYRTHVWLDSFDFVDTPILLTHAGFNGYICNQLDLMSPKNEFNYSKFYSQITMADQDQNSWFFWASRKRGGLHPVGGPLWNDATEFIPIYGIRQIFGHTPQNSPKIFSDGSMCIDVEDGVFVGVIVEEDGTIGDFVYVK